MPKERRDRSLSLDRSRLSPYPCSSSCSRQSSSENPLEADENIKQWEDARCPICMEHPHNAILLLCSSHEKGCRPFMCDTSYRHSNCFDQFRKSFGDASADAPIPEDMPDLTPSVLPDTIAIDASIEDERSTLEGSTSLLEVPPEDPVKPKLLCPLCRGSINGWIVVQSARGHMNAKSRSCACETCDFSGTYADLRKHARLAHALARPADADPERQRNWRRLERQRDLGDLLSTLQSSMGDEMTGESTLTIDEGGWLTVFFLVRFIRPENGSSRSRVRTRSSRRLWGETVDGGERESREDEDEDESASNREEGYRRHYVRRRLRDPDNQ